MEYDIKQGINEAVMNCIQRAGEMESGSDERSKEISNATNLIRTLNDDYRNSEEAFDRQKRTEIEMENSKEELAIKRLQAESDAEAKKEANRDTRRKYWLIAAMIFGERLVEAKGYMVPRFWNRICPKFWKN